MIDAQTITDTLKAAGRPLGLAEIAEGIGMSSREERAALARKLCELRKLGELDGTPSPGSVKLLYRLPADGEVPPRERVSRQKPRKARLRRVVAVPDPSTGAYARLEGVLRGMLDEQEFELMQVLVELARKRQG